MPVYNGLDSHSITDSLSANMGRELKVLHDEHAQAIANHATAISNHASSIAENANEIQRVAGLIPTPETDSGWVDMLLNEGWSITGYTYDKPQYRKIGKFVFLRGLVNATQAAEATICTLPTGYRPTGYFNIFGDIHINASGVVRDRTKDGTSGRENFSLNGVVFVADY